MGISGSYTSERAFITSSFVNCINFLLKIKKYLNKSAAFFI
jgi:hypothetical protein